MVFHDTKFQKKNKKNEFFYNAHAKPFFCDFLRFFSEFYNAFLSQKTHFLHGFSQMHIKNVM